jgi:hypothetical protein
MNHRFAVPLGLEDALRGYLNFLRFCEQRVSGSVRDVSIVSRKLVGVSFMDVVSHLFFVFVFSMQLYNTTNMALLALLS